MLLPNDKEVFFTISLKVPPPKKHRTDLYKNIY